MCHTKYRSDRTPHYRSVLMGDVKTNLCVKIMCIMRGKCVWWIFILEKGKSIAQKTAGIESNHDGDQKDVWTCGT